MTNETRERLLKLCELSLDVVDSCGDEAFDQCVTAGNAGRAREYTKLMPIIHTLLSVNQRLSEALKQYPETINIYKEPMTMIIDKQELSIAGNALAFEDEEIGKLVG